MKSKTWVPGLPTVIFVVAVVPLLFGWSPLDYVWEAGPSAYYQARFAYEHGGAGARAKIKSVADKGKITIHDYSATVFPMYLDALPPGENNPFPAVEANKTIEQLRGDLALAVNKK